jgi:aldehyde dehydrogenase (NAD(P)+)
MPALPAPAATDQRHLDEAISRLKEAAPRWASAALPERISLARALLQGVARTAERMVQAACAAKGASPDGPLAGEDWLLGPYITARILRQLVHSLSLLARNGNTPVGPLGETVDGRLSVRVFPASRRDALLFMGVRADVHLEEGVTEDELHATRARFHKAPDHAGRVALVLGAGNVNAIAPTDVATKLFNEGKVCLLKMNPVNAYLGPLLEEAFAEAIARGYVAVVYGGAAEGGYLAQHPGIDEVHVTGSDRTHDALVWGPPGPERAERMARGRPLLAKPITSELGNVTPVLVVPGPWDAGTLRFQAESVAGMVTVNGAYNCTAARVLVTPRRWRQRDAFLSGVEHNMALSPPRADWYPGARERYRALTEGRPALRRVGEADGTLPWTMLPGVDPEAQEPAFTNESFCSLLVETSVGSEDPLEYLDRAVAFANERLWGTLCAHLVVHPKTMADPSLRGAVERAIRKLRYGSVSVNCYAGYAFAFGTAPWGAYPGSTPSDVQSGRGFVHNTLMLERIEKVVVRQPAWSFPKPVYFPSHRTLRKLAPKLVELETRGSLLGLPGIVVAGARG